MTSIDVLMVEDNSGDVVLLREALERLGLSYRIRVATDGMEAMEVLRRQGLHKDAPRPEVIVLDLKLPRKGGREVLAELAGDPDLARIPVVVLSSSRSELELVRVFNLPEECRMIKPSTFTGYIEAARVIEAARRKGEQIC